MPRKIRVLVGKPGLDGHDRGAKVVAAALRDAGMEVIYTGLHQTPAQVVEAALQEDVDVVALSILSGAHMTLFPEVFELMKSRGIADKLLTGGGIIPPEDMKTLAEMGVGRLFGPGASTQDIAVYIRGWFVDANGPGSLEPAEMPRPPEPRPVPAPTVAELRHHADAPKVGRKPSAVRSSGGNAKPRKAAASPSARSSKASGGRSPKASRPKKAAASRSRTSARAAKRKPSRTGRSASARRGR